MTTEQLWQRYRILNLQRANLIKMFKDDAGFNPDNLATTVRTKEFEKGDIVWSSYSGEFVHILDDEEGPAKQLLCLYENGRTQSIPVCYLFREN